MPRKPRRPHRTRRNSSTAAANLDTAPDLLQSCWLNDEGGALEVPQVEEAELSWSDLDRRAVDTVRVLAADAVEKVGNGHPGTAMSLAPLAYTLFQRAMRHRPRAA